MSHKFSPVSITLPKKDGKVVQPPDLVATVTECNRQTASLILGGTTFADHLVKLSIGASMLVNAGIDGYVQVRLMNSTDFSATVRFSSIPEQARLFGAFESMADQTPFTPKEQADIRSALAQVINEVRNSRLATAEQIAALKEQLDEAAEASQRLGRKDWLNCLLGLLVSVTVSAGFSTEAAKALVLSVESALGHAVSAAVSLLTRK
ncbi:hypothetical protein V0R50_26385 [Pseudomonas sp. 148P]|uniref:Uncharacterized protein n=1 Tax=Pseudomonas ulcerans TaxID=3115852 RepID=A0ABU7HZF8_9PSED|nr:MULTISPECIES: hypothetical protein [unclassified Pseudomonas]MEE1925312.1 hypothetical protein [Pseudomonas sp. 147P]MEE1936766.1 hypothetical protein [Pseudomonas sp. 148P]